MIDGFDRWSLEYVKGLMEKGGKAPDCRTSAEAAWNEQQKQIDTLNKVVEAAKKLSMDIKVGAFSTVNIDRLIAELK